MTTLKQIKSLPAEIGELTTLAQTEGFSFVQRLQDDFISGNNRFDRSGEVLFEVRMNDILVAVGGLNRDPYEEGNHIGRVRRLYVHPHYRSQGIGKRLMDEIERHAAKSFRVVQLFTDNSEACAFYEILGYERRHEDKRVSHVKHLNGA